MKIKQLTLLWLNIIIVLSFVFAVEVNGQRRRSSRTPAATPTTAARVALPVNAFSRFPLGQAKQIELEIEEEAIDGMTARERADQIKDWLLFAVLNDSKLPAAALNQITYDLPTSRRKYFQPVANFEYGEIRSRFIGDGKIVVLLPTTGSENERLDYLAKTADEHRKNLGAMPTTLIVFEYKINLDEQSAQVTRGDDYKVADLYTEQAGYYEADITDLQSFTGFMDRIEDVTFASRTGNQLRLGGRKMKAKSYRGIRVEDVAAIWSSENKIAQAQQQFTAKWNAQQKRVKDAHDSIINLTKHLRNFNTTAASAELNKIRILYRTQNFITFDRTSGGIEVVLPASLYNKVEALVKAFNGGDNAMYNVLIKQIEQEFADQNALLVDNYNADQVTKNIVSESGFSLDPAYDYVKLAKYFQEELSPSLRELIRAQPTIITNKDIEEAARGLENKDETQLLQLLKKIDAGFIKETGNPNAAFGLQILSTINDQFSYQHARYDGELEGTEVGMVLFYTDLMAKLWGFDFAGSAPVKIDGFVPKPDIKLSTLYISEFWKLSQTRLWFGPQNKGFQTVESGQKVAFARQATRLFSKSSNQFSPKEEVESNMLNNLFINWWDNHFEEIAKYEPQYQRLNEIMKWSLLIGWLNDAGILNKLSFLDGVPVKRDNRFPTWARKNTDLKFKDWEQIQFFPDADPRSKTEALPLLHSRNLAIGGLLKGGVSLAGKTVFKERAPLKPQVNELIRRPNIDYNKPPTAAGNITTLEGNSFSVRSLPRENAQVTYSPKNNAKLRETSSELSVNTKFDRKISRTGDSLQVETEAGSVKIGTLEFNAEADKLKINFKSRDVDQGHSLARKLSRMYDEFEADNFLKSQAEVQKAYVDRNGQYLVKLSGSDKWLVLAPGERGSATVAKGWTSRVADRRDGRSSYNLKWINEAEANRQLPGAQKIVDNTGTPGAPPTPRELSLADNLLQQNEPVKAIKYLTDLAERCKCDLPELKLRQGVALAKRGQFEAAQQKFNESLTTTGDSSNKFIDEFNTRQGKNNFNLASDGNGKGFSIHQPLDINLDRFPSVAPDKIPESALIYLEDAPGLGGQDWSVGIQKTINNLVVGELAEVIRLPRGGIGDFNPTRIYSGGTPIPGGGGGGGGGRRFNAIATGSAEGSSNWMVAKPYFQKTSPTILFPCTEDDDRNDKEDDDDCSIYLVIKKRKQ
jgi:hypothetical protein